MKCKKCGKTFPDYGKICPYCGTKPANGRKTTGLMIGVIVVLTAVLATVTLFAINPGTKKGGTSQKDEVYFRELDPADVVMDLGCIGYVDNELLITAELGTKRSAIVDIAEKYGAEIVGEISECCDYQLMFSEKLPKERLEAIAAEVNDMPGVMYASLNYVSYSSECSVDYEPDMGEWSDDSLNRWGYNAVNANGAWELLNDNNEIVEPVYAGVVDGGFIESYEDTVWRHKPFYNTEDEHGTATAAIFAASGKNDTGMCGIYPYGDNMLYGASVNGAPIDNASKSTIEMLNSIMQTKVCFEKVITAGGKGSKTIVNYSMGASDAFIASMCIYEDKNNISIFDNCSRILSYSLINLRDQKYDFVIVAASGNSRHRKYLALLKDIENDCYIVDHENGRIYVSDTELKELLGNYKYKGDGDNSDKTIKFSSDKNDDNYNFIVNNEMPAEFSSPINRINYSLARTEEQKEKFNDLRKRIVVVGAVTYDDSKKASDSSRYLPENLKVTSFSNIGDRVDIYAPGKDIYVPFKDGSYGLDDGTSYSAPIVSGIAAMIWSANNDLRGDQVRAILLNNKVATSEENVYIPDAEACVRQALRSNPEYYYPGSDDTSKYEWTLSPSIEAEDIIVYNIEETGYDHSIFNDLAYIKQNGKYGIIDYSGEFLAKCTTEGYLISAPYLGQLSAGGLVLGSGNGDFVRYDQSGGIGLEDVNRYYSEDDKATYICRGIGDNGNFYRVDSEDELNTVRLAKFVPTNNSDYLLIEESKGTDWGIARGNTLIADCEYEAAIVPLNFKYSPNLKSGSISAIRENGKWCYIDSNGNKITGFDFNGIEGAKPAQMGFDFEQESANTLKSFSPFLPTEGLIAVKTDEGAGYIDTSGNTVIAPGTFAETRPVHNGLAWVKHKSSGLWGVIRIFAADNSGSGQEVPTTVPPELPTEQQITVPESANSYIGLWHGKAYYGDGRNVTNEVMKDVREYYEEDITFAEFIEIEIRENGTATMYQRRRQKRVDCNWRADGNLVILIDHDDQSVIYTLESQNSTTLKLTWDDEDKYILLDKS